MSAIRRQGRPELTESDAQAMHRIARSADGRALLDRLERVKHYKQDMSPGIKDYGEQMQHQGKIREITELLREFTDAEAATRIIRPVVNQQKRFG